MNPEMRRSVVTSIRIKVAAVAHGDFLFLSRWTDGVRSEDYFREHLAMLGRPVVRPPIEELDRIVVEELGGEPEVIVEASLPVWTDEGPSDLLLVNRLRWDDRFGIWDDVDVELRWRGLVEPPVHP